MHKTVWSKLSVTECLSVCKCSCLPATSVTYNTRLTARVACRYDGPGEADCLDSSRGRGEDGEEEALDQFVEEEMRLAESESRDGGRVSRLAVMASRVAGQNIITVCVQA